MSFSKLQQAMQLLMRTFYEYSSLQGDSESMTRTEVFVTLRSELKDPMCMKEMDKVFNNLDTNGDNVVTFEEFVGLVTEIAMKSPDLDMSQLSEDFQQSSKLLQAMRNLLEGFTEYAKLSGHPDTMSKGEVIFMISEQMKDKGLTEALEIAKKLDADSDGVVTFKEFVAIVTELKPMYR